MRNILKQSSYLFFALLLTRVISFFYIIYLARVLGVSNFGLYSVALAYFSIISSVADLGFNRFLVREISIDKSKASELFSNVILLRLTLTAVLFAVFSVVLYSIDHDSIRVSLTLLAAFALIPQSIALTFDAIFTALQKLQFSAVGLFLSSLFTALSGLFLISRGYGTSGAIGGLVIGQIIYAVFLFFALKDTKISFSLIKLSIFKKTLKGSLPYGFLGVLGLLYFRIDTVLLSYLKGSFETGVYSAGYKFLEAVIFIPAAFSAALFPALAKLHEENKHELKKLYFKSLKLMSIAGIAVAVAYILILPILINKFLPSYVQAIDVIKILALSIPFMFIHVPAVQVLLSTDKFLKPVILLSFVTLGFNVLANLIFLPSYGFMAAAWITTISEILSFVIFYLLVTKRVLR